jgi:serine/threonine protein kinase
MLPARKLWITRLAALVQRSVASLHFVSLCVAQDMWGIGCVLFETLALFPLFPGSNEADQIERIHKVGGSGYNLRR